MSFGRPEFLLLLAVPLLIAVWELTRRYPRVALPFDYGEQRSGRWLGYSASLAGLLPAALLTVAIVIFSRPLRTAEPKQERQLTNIEFVLDVSGSMTAKFGEGTQYDAAMAAIEQFTSGRKGDAFGLTIFGNEVLRWTPLTKDLSAIRNATPFLQPDSLPGHFGGTEVGKAVKFCGDQLLERGEGDRLIILLSDGESADLGTARSRQIASQLAEDQIVLYAIHIGDRGPPSDLFELVRPTGGQVFAASNPEALNTVFGHIDQMQPVRSKPAAAQQVDAFGPFAWAGLAVLGLLQTALFGLRYTPW